ncbi:MAG: hypothetical protein Q3968_00900 [Clostridiaceae bacterium]|nr:hypothetical protein [Clostridiaceae bacterium]
MAEIIDYEPPEDDGEVLPPEEQLKKAQESLNELKKNMALLFDGPIRTAALAAYDISERTGEFIKEIGRLAEKALACLPFTRQFLSISYLANAQYVYWDYLDDDFENDLLNADNTDEVLLQYHKKDKFKSVLDTAEKCLNSSLIQSNRSLFEQSVKAFKRGDCDISVVGLIATIDGMVPLFPDKPRLLDLKERIEPILKKLENQEAVDKEEFSEYIFITTFSNTYKTIWADSYFIDEEPPNLNRHWIVHGRSSHDNTKLDCIKLIHFLYGIILLDELTKASDTEVENV